MKKPIIATIVLSLLCVLAGCKHAADLGKYKDQAVALATKYGPQLGDLTKKLPDLLARAKALPVGIPGADKVASLLADNQAQLDKLQGLLTNLPTQVAGSPTEAEKTITDAEKTISDGVTSVTANVESAQTDLGKLEEAAKTAAPAAASVAPGATQGFTTKLSSGDEIHGNADGVEAKLVAFLQDASKPVDKTTWFDFDRLVFQSGKAELDAEKSAAQLTNVAEILKAFPNTKLKIGGYTDNTGSPDANKAISQQRAEHVVTALVAVGVAKDRLEAEGYGPQFPVCPANDTDECKAKNRRIAIRVTGK